MDQDMEIQCIEEGCGTFVLTPGEQQFYQDKGFSYPKRCKKHREERKKQRLEKEQA